MPSVGLSKYQVCQLKPAHVSTDAMVVLLLWMRHTVLPLTDQIVLGPAKCFTPCAGIEFFLSFFPGRP